jgi:xylulokinase
MWLDTRGASSPAARSADRVEGYNPRRILPFVESRRRPSPVRRRPHRTDPVPDEPEPAIMAATRWMMEPVDYLTMRFTGVASATHASRLASG